MSTQLTGKVDVDLAQPSILSRRSPIRYVLLLAGLAVLVLLPYWVYPPVAMDILCWGLFAISVDLLLGFTGLLSFGHAAFWGGSAYCTGLIAIHWGVPFPVAVLGGAVFSMLIAWPIGYLSVRRTGIYFAMVTLAFAQMLYFVANQARSLTGGENGLQGIPQNFFGIEAVETDSFYFYYAGAAMIVLGLLLAWRVVNSPFGRVLTAVRDNPARARALGYDVEVYKIKAFVISAGLAGVGALLLVARVGAAEPAANTSFLLNSVAAVVLGGVSLFGGRATIFAPVMGALLLTALVNGLTRMGFSEFYQPLTVGVVVVLAAFLTRFNRS